MPVVGPDHVQVAAPRVPWVEEQARAFYGGLLGLSELEKPDILKPKVGVWFSLGRGELHVGLEAPFSPRSRLTLRCLCATWLRFVPGWTR